MRAWVSRYDGAENHVPRGSRPAPGTADHRPRGAQLAKTGRSWPGPLHAQERGEDPTSDDVNAMTCGAPTITMFDLGVPDQSNLSRSLDSRGPPLKYISTRREPFSGSRTLRRMRATDFVALRERCLGLIDQYYRDPKVGPNWLADQLFVSRRQLDRAFVGCPSVAEILAKRRVRQVVAMAAHRPEIPMSEIARYYGYGTYETFRAQCHRYLGCSPREARDDQSARLLAPRRLPDVA